MPTAAQKSASPARPKSAGSRAKSSAKATEARQATPSTGAKTATKTAVKNKAERSANGSKGSKPRQAAKPAKPQDAIELLTADHREVKALFKAYEKQVKAKGEPSQRQSIAMEICAKLSAHATAEEELFYPAARGVLKKDELMLVDEADVEHASAKDLIAQIEGGNAGDPLYDAKVKVLGEYIDHHVKEEEGELFPKVRKSRLDLQGLAADLAARKAELLA